MCHHGFESEIYSVRSTCEIAYSYHFSEDVFNGSNSALADLYKPWGRCLAIVDTTVYALYGKQIETYFKTNDVALSARPAFIPEDRKSIESLLEVCSWINEFDLIRREPVLVIGGGLITDVVGFACAIYRRSTHYIRVPTTLIGLIDASVSNRVAVNWNGLKNRLGAYHEPLHTFIDPAFLKTLPVAEIRNGIAEILKISSCTHLETFELLEQHGKSLVDTRFAQRQVEESHQLKMLASKIIRQSIQSVLDVEVPNSREQDLDRVMFFGHTWSPVLELAVVPALMHGHAISVDMCFSASLAFVLGHLSLISYHRFVKVFSSVGLAIDHPAFTLELMKRATASTIATRDGRLRAPVPTGDLGTHKILQQVEPVVLEEAWSFHKNQVAIYARGGLGLEMTIDFRLVN